MSLKTLAAVVAPITMVAFSVIGDRRNTFTLVERPRLAGCCELVQRDTTATAFAKLVLNFLQRSHVDLKTPVVVAALSVVLTVLPPLAFP